MILSALCPLHCNSTRPQHTLQMFADHCGPRQTIPWETINQGLLQPQFSHRSWDHLLEFRTSFYETIRSEFLVQGNFKHTQFSREHWYWQDLNLQPLAPKARAVSSELTWLLKNTSLLHIKVVFPHKHANHSPHRITPTHTYTHTPSRVTLSSALTDISQNLHEYQASCWCPSEKSLWYLQKRG